jgi:hypothetical protein
MRRLSLLLDELPHRAAAAQDDQRGKAYGQHRVVARCRCCLRDVVRGGSGVRHLRGRLELLLGRLLDCDDLVLRLDFLGVLTL